MQKEKRYKMFLMNGKHYEIDEADLAKLRDNAGEMLVQLKQVMVHPSSIVAIEPFYVNYRANAEISETGGARIAGMIAPAPINDLFSNEVLKLSEHE